MIHVAIAAAAAVATAALNPAAPAAEPMLDGRCDDQGAPVASFETASLYLTQTADHVWLCVSWPHAGHGVADLWIDAPGLNEPLNLHASAQLGEWPAERPDAGPADAQSPLWWNHAGWAANSTRFNGTERTQSGSRPRFRPVTGREFQMSKARFGRGTWALRLAMMHIGTASGGSLTADYPAKGLEPLSIRVR